MTKREYLVSLGLAKEGRGKFSKAGLEELAKAEADGMSFDDNKPKAPAAPKPEKVEPVRNPADYAKPVPKPLPKLREQKTMYALTPEGYKVGYDSCWVCHNPVSTCPCKSGPQPCKGATAVIGNPRW
jgi:hypothetical protein